MRDCPRAARSSEASRLPSAPASVAVSTSSLRRFTIGVRRVNAKNPLLNAVVTRTSSSFGPFRIDTEQPFGGTAARRLVFADSAGTRCRSEAPATCATHFAAEGRSVIARMQGLRGRSSAQRPTKMRGGPQMGGQMQEMGPSGTTRRGAVVLRKQKGPPERAFLSVAGAGFEPATFGL